MTIADIKKTMESKMDQSIQAFGHGLTKIRTGRANPGLLDSVQVDYYGNMTPITQVANDPRAHAAHDRRATQGVDQGGSQRR